MSIVSFPADIKGPYLVQVLREDIHIIAAYGKDPLGMSKDRWPRHDLTVSFAVAPTPRTEPEYRRG